MSPEEEISQELGRIEKPDAGKFLKLRKLYFVPLLYAGEGADQEYTERVDRYWSQVDSHINELEKKLGPVSRIYHEFVTRGDQEGLKAIKEINSRTHALVSSRMDSGAQLELIEDSEILAEFMDWNRCLFMGLQSQKAFSLVYQNFTEVSRKRNEHIARRIDETLKPDEAAVLLMKEGHQVQFPADIEVFYVAPPALDEVRRFIRDQETRPPETETPT